jgi:hypothetical protein
MIAEKEVAILHSAFRNPQFILECDVMPIDPGTSPAL